MRDISFVFNYCILRMRPIWDWIIFIRLDWPVKVNVKYQSQFTLQYLPFLLGLSFLNYIHLYKYYINLRSNVKMATYSCLLPCCTWETLFPHEMNKYHKTLISWHFALISLVSCLLLHFEIDIVDVRLKWETM